MSVLPIYTYGAPVLRKKAVPLAAVTPDKIKTLDDIRRLLLAGADCVMLASSLLRKGPAHVSALLRGVEALVNTYWVRFDKGANTQPAAVENTKRLVEAAVKAGVKRIVHISIANPSAESHLPYYWGKAANEKAVTDSGLSYAILRPTVLFGTEDILINNIAWLLRRFPFFAIAGAGAVQARLEVQRR